MRAILFFFCQMSNTDHDTKPTRGSTLLYLLAHYHSASHYESSHISHSVLHDCGLAGVRQVYD